MTTSVRNAHERILIKCDAEYFIRPKASNSVAPDRGLPHRGDVLMEDLAYHNLRDFVHSKNELEEKFVEQGRKRKRGGGQERVSGWSTTTIRKQGCQARRRGRAPMLSPRPVTGHSMRRLELHDVEAGPLSSSGPLTSMFEMLLDWLDRIENDL
ncbi:hypothetical protein BD779DRAFT_1478339 [Infundibulicybe gibba]|nr:hypothetical protein BD779DRAFT_1478339 [Infundibulicybe gibba]